MVAISLYRGNLHRVPDTPRRWLMPTPKISLKDFKSLLTRRSKSLHTLRRPSATATAAATTATTTTTTTTTAAAVAVASAETATTSNPNWRDNAIRVKTEPQLEEFRAGRYVAAANPKEEEKGLTSEGGGSKEEVKDHGGGGGGLGGGVCTVKQEVVNLLVAGDNKEGKCDEVMTVSVGMDDKEMKGVDQLPAEKPHDEAANPDQEATDTDNADELNEKEKREREIEEKLKVLTAKKHNLVQVLKQIFSVEEELKRRNSMQGMASRPSGPLQVDVTNDSGSMTRNGLTPRTGTESNVGGDAEGGETEDGSNQNVFSRQRHRMSSMSPSSESPLRRPPHVQHSVVPHPSRSTLGAIGSPSRFAPTGNQGHPANLPAVCASGTNYIASSPSPAASGGTSAFRDAWQPSPWN